MHKMYFLTNVSKHKGLHEKDYGNIKYLNNTWSKNMVQNKIGCFKY